MKTSQAIAALLRGEGVRVAPWAGYCLAFAIFCVGLAARFALLPVEAGFPFLTFYPAVVMTALLFGGRPGLLTLLLSVAAAIGFFIPWPWSIGLALRTAVFVFCAGIVCFLTDRTRRHAADLGKSEQQLRALYELSPLGIALTDLQGRFVEFNEAFRRLTGYSEAELKALDYWALTPQQYKEAEAAQLESLARTGHYGPYEKEYVRKDGGRVPLQLNGALITGQDGRKYIWSIVEDISRRKRADALAALEQAVSRCLAEADDALQVLQGVMRAICESERWESAGYFQVEDGSDACRLIAGWSGPDAAPATVEYYKGTMDTVVPPGGLLSRVVASGRPIWIADMAQSQTTWRERLQRTGQRATLSLPVWSDGKVIGVMAFSSSTIREPDELLLHTVGAIGERLGQVLKRKQAEAEMRKSEAALRESEAKFAAMFRLTPDPMALTRVRDGVLLEVSRSYADSLGYEHDEVVGRSTLPGDLGIWVEAGHRRQWLEQLAASGEVTGFETPMRRKDGSIAIFLISAKIVRMGAEECVIVVHHDISRQKQHEEHLSRIANHDPLTKLPNRRLLADRLQQALVHGRRTGTQVAVCYLDLDGFKEVNDTLGHPVGDRVLEEVAKRLLAAVRGGDTVARLGGDEFVLVLGGLVGPTECVAALERLVGVVAAPYDIDQRRVTGISASIGVTLAPDDGAEPDKLVRHADLAMYAAKQEGKNRFHFFDPPRDHPQVWARTAA
jgi:diguanylate cyclase (GGDEF)-like protein/PAS domain S-box-containing protein